MCSTSRVRPRVSNALLLSYARSIAERIEDEILATVSVSEMSLLRDYLAACRHATGPVLALSEDIVMMNHLAQQRLDAADRTALVARTDDAVGEVLPRTLVADLPSGAIARLDYRPTSVGSAVVGGVFRVQIQEASSRPLRGADSRTLTTPLPGVAGTSPEWTRAGSQLRESHRAGTWVLLVGERGVGKHALARAVHVAESPARHLRVLDAEAAELDPDEWFQHLEDELASEEGTLIIRHIDRLPASLVESVSSRLLEESDRSHSAPARWVVATREAAVIDDALESQIVPCFDRTIAVEPLRHRPDDIRAMTPPCCARSPRRATCRCRREPSTSGPSPVAGQRDPAARRAASRARSQAHGHDRARRPAAGVHGRGPAHPHPAGVAGARRHHAGAGRPRRQQGPGGRPPRHVAGHDLPQDPRLQHRHPTLTPGLSLTPGPTVTRTPQEGSRIDTAWMSMPMSPPTSVPLIRMNCRSRPTCELDPLGSLLAVPPVDGVADHLVSSAP